MLPLPFGDGTVSAAAASLMDSGKVLAILPAGTMNLFARSLGIPLDLQLALQSFATGHIQAVDIATANGRPFVHQFSIGMHAKMVHLRESMDFASRLGKIRASCRAAYDTLLDPPAMHVALTIDGAEIRTRSSAIGISNNLFGEGHLPYADRPDGGVLGVYVTIGRTRGELLRFFINMARGKWRDNDIEELLQGFDTPARTPYQQRVVERVVRQEGFGADDARSLADAAIAQVNLTEQAGRKIREYSKGMRQRIKIAQALAHKPNVLVLDEPLAGTDPVGRRHIISLIKGLGDEGKTVLVSSHILNEVEQMTMNILLINKGRVIADGNIYRIREMIDEHPHTIFVDSTEPRKFAALLAAHEDIVSVAFLDVGFQVATRDPDACYSRIPKLALQHGFELRRMTSPDNNLMAVFNYLVH